MKKIVSVVLVMVMLLSVMPVISSSAEIFYNGMFAEKSYSIRISAENPVEYRAFYPEESGYYSVYSQNGDYSDPYIYCFDEDHNELWFDDDNGFNKNFNHIAYFEKDKVYKFEVSATNDTGKAYFNMVITKIDDRIIDINAGDRHEVTMDVSERLEYFKFTPESSDYYAFQSYQPLSFSYGVLYDSEWNKLDEDDDSGYHSCFYLSYYLEEGKTYYYMSSADYFSLANTYEVSVEPCEVICDMNILSYPDRMTYYDGYIDEMKDFTGLSVEFIYTDGSTLKWDYTKNDSWEYEVYGTTIDVDVLQDEDGRYFVYVLADYAYEEFDIEVIECPVESISVSSASNVFLYEGMSGQELENHETGTRYFWYDYRLPSDLMIQINFTDGTSIVTSYFERYNGLRFTYGDNQRTQPWSVGQNPVTISFCDKECTYYVDVIDSPVDYITVDKAPSAQYVYYVNGGNSTEGNYYEFYPDLSGIELTVHYKNGTTQKLTSSDMDPWYHTIGGYPYYLSTHKAYAPGKVTVSFEYCNRDVTFDVVVLGVGDCDADGTVSVMDATKLQMYLAGSASLTTAEKKVSDADVDGEISVMDATEIQRYVAGIIEEL